MARQTYTLREWIAKYGKRYGKTGYSHVQKCCINYAAQDATYPYCTLPDGWQAEKAGPNRRDEWKLSRISRKRNRVTSTAA